MTCIRKSEYIQDSSREHLENLQDEVFQTINEIVGIIPQFGMPDETLLVNRQRLLNNSRYPIRIVSPNGRITPLFIEGTRRIWVLDHNTWGYGPNRWVLGNLNVRGLYWIKAGAILLHEPIWCRHTLIHETLHSTSLFCRAFQQYGSINWNLQNSFREGITETITGYILQRNYPECYEAWRTNRFTECRIDGRSRVKFWCSLCQCVGIADLANFYFSLQNNVNEQWTQYSESLQEQGFEEFSYPIGEDTIYNEGQLRQISFNAIPGLKDIYDDLERCLDFYRIE